MATQTRNRTAAAASRNGEGGMPEEVENFIRRRKSQRRIKGDGNGRRHKLSEAVVLASDGSPDLRFAENREKFLHDPSKRVTGEPDRRLVENREDILALHAQRGETKPNVIFEDDN